MGEPTNKPFAQMTRAELLVERDHWQRTHDQSASEAARREARRHWSRCVETLAAASGSETHDR